MNKLESLTDRMYQAQGQAPPIDVAGKQYVFKKLKRKECHRILYNLVRPFIDVVSTIMGALGNSFSDLTEGKFDFKKIDVSVIGDIIDTVPFDNFWDLACSILNDVIVDGKEIGKLDDTEYYDDKQIEMLRAIFAGIQVNYPFLTGLIKKPRGGKNDLNQSPETEKE